MTLRTNPASDWVHFLIYYLTFQTQALKQKYSISGIPALIVIRKSDGQLITKVLFRAKDLWPSKTGIKFTTNYLDNISVARNGVKSSQIRDKSPNMATLMAGNLMLTDFFS